MKIEAAVKNLKNILVNDEKFYQIPDYQRPYSWDKENVSLLIEDSCEAFKSGDDEYFCGSLVLVENGASDRLDIIDGQQRTTTFIIIACVIRDLFFDGLKPKAKDYIKKSIQDQYDEKKRKLKFLTGEKFQIDFEESVLKGIDFSLNRNKLNNKYLENAYYAKDSLIEQIKEHEIDINDFVIWFFESVSLTTIICPSSDAAIKIFNVLNNRGMPLSPIDILKSSLMQDISDISERKSFKNKWDHINDTLELSGLDLENMLTNYLFYKITKNPKARLDKELLSVFKADNKTGSSTIYEIEKFSKAYIEILTSPDKNIHCLKYLRHRPYWTSILTVALYKEYQDIEKLKKLLLAYYYQNWIAGATIARIKQTSFNVLKLVKANEDIAKIESELLENLNKYETTKYFKNSINHSSVYGKNWDRAVLLLINYFLTEGKVSYIPLDKKLHLEHILPQNPKPEWDDYFTEEDKKYWTNSLANLTLLSMRKNIQASNNSFSEKKDIYQNKDNVTTPFVITNNIWKYDVWNTESLESRREEMKAVINNRIDIFGE